MSVKIDSGLAQIIVAILGLFGPVIVGWLKDLQSPQPATQDLTISSLTGPPSSPPKRRSLLDLSIVLVCASFFSGILSDSLLVSGRVPSLSISVLLQILLITLLTSGMLVISWFHSKSEIGIGVAALTTLIVLLLSPGGPISVGREGGEPGLSLYIPLLVLIMQISACAIYHYGSPLSRDTTRRQ